MDRALEVLTNHKTAWAAMEVGGRIELLDRMRRDIHSIEQRWVAAGFVESGGTAEAFVRDPGEAISQSTRDWVDGYVPNQLGEGRYIAHVTVGFATLDDLEAIEAEPFEEFDVHPASLAVYHLGNSGAARQVLREWPLG